MPIDSTKVYGSSNLQELNDDLLAERLAEVFPGPPAAPEASTRELNDRMTAIRDQILKKPVKFTGLVRATRGRH